MKDYQYAMLFGFLTLIHSRQLRGGDGTDRVLGVVLSICGVVLLTVALVEQFS